jgi:hypothetical protein
MDTKPTKAQDTQVFIQHIKALAASANALVVKGELDDAEDIYKKILDAAPYHASSLSFCASRAASKGDLKQALAYMDKAIQGNKHKPLLFLNRALIYKRLGQLDSALSDLDIAIGLQTDLHKAMLHKAFILREKGDWIGAVKIITGVWKQLNKNKLVDRGAVDESTRALLEEASKLVRAAQLVLIDAELNPIISKYGKESLRRVFEGVAICVGLVAKREEEGMLQPGTLSIPGLAQQEFGTIEFPGLAAVQDRGDSLCGDITGLLKQQISSADTSTFNGVDGKADTGPRRYALDLNDSRLSDIPVLAVLRADSCIAAGIEGQFPVSVLRVPPGKHVLYKNIGENWILTAYLVMQASGAIDLSAGGINNKLSSRESVVASNLVDHIIDYQGPQDCQLLSLRLWHPGLTKAEVLGILGVFHALRRFRQSYVWDAAI